MVRSRTLTEEMVFMRTKCNRMDLIRNLNLCGNDLQDIGVLQCMPNLEVLSLSVNQVSSLADLQHCARLMELYLRKNEICDLGQIYHLKGLRHMRVLMLADNPCANLPHYRLFLVHHLPCLTRIDAKDVTEDERRQAKQTDFSQVPILVDGRGYSPTPSDEASEPVGDLPDRRAEAVIAECGSPDAKASSPICVMGPTGQGAPDQRARQAPSFELDSECPEHMERSPCNGAGRSWTLSEDVPARRSPNRAALSPGPPPPPINEDVPGWRSPNRSALPPGSPPPPVNEEQYHRGNKTRPQPLASKCYGFGEDTSPSPMASGVPIGRQPKTAPGEGGLGLGPQNSWVGSPGPRMLSPGSPVASAWSNGAASPGAGATLPSKRRSDNILCAVLSLVKELDSQGLELVRRAVDQRSAEL
mmetsp:Transcript_50489/g.97535  ORF Transcript_50489/g.97535 Transcript_50489/m.97535 type:complete len:415 (-) Transcript_50489:220-1464(-)